ncbi:putative dna-binding protein hgh1 protein [Phaeoacremonium minimum UCRPA7]|uniref:Protein HGH1 homolog n=1 Tax=Phaeoacremonium minimum (strain UCR-PA7) TaxID=1286976 RepID=R8BWP6_PHAM7|nr:putative dna-binding protein hgh1 protein [Phaeoacremonium minimum UCRPA7]EOO03778.1 putative dna-binding protein hgh1 protein [Phaeoacremonium minimum UCRPA7]
MPTELEELVGFIAHPNPQIRQIAVEHLVPYSIAQPSIFKTEQQLPIRNLKLLIRDEPKIAEHVITMLVNLSGDSEVLANLVKDEKFLDAVFAHIIYPEEPNANLYAMLLANLAKSDALKSVMDRKQTAPETLGSDNRVINQLLDLFVKGSDGSFNKNADFDYLAYVFADLAKHPEVRQYFVQKQEYDGVVPITKLKVFTEHKSDVRRKGVASTIKNVAFDVPSHPLFLSEDDINILPYILLPITGNEEYDVDDTMSMLPDLQLLPPDKQRDKDHNIIQTHVETLTLLTSTREGRELMREIKVYPIVRETHLRVDDEGVREACERLVQVLMRDEEDDGNAARVIEEDEDDQIVEI